MRKILILIALTFNALGSELETLCKDSIFVTDGYTYKSPVNFYQKDNLIYTYGISLTGESFIKVFDQVNTLLLSTTSDLPVKDLLVDGNNVYTLHTGEIRQHDLKTLEIMNTYYTKLIPTSKYDVAYKFIKTGDTFLIAHGVSGVVSININDSAEVTVTPQDVPQDQGQVSEATGISVDGDKVYVVYDNVTYDFSKEKRAFEGIFISSMNNLSSGKAISINASREALHKGNLFIADGKLYSQHLHILFEYDLEKLENLKYFWPSRRLFNFNGTQIFGKASVQNSTVTSCFQKYDHNTDGFSAFFEKFKI